MSGIFDNILKQFKNTAKLEGGHGPDVVSTNLGTCIVPDADGNSIQYRCIEKKFGTTSTFNKVVSAFEHIQQKPQIKDYFPDVYHIDRNKITIKTAYFACDSLEEYFLNIDIFDTNNEREVNGMFLSINDMLNTLIQNDISHGDLHTGNVLYCHSKYRPMFNLKLIDLDDAKSIASTTDWDEDKRTLKTDEKGEKSDKYQDSAELSKNIRIDLLRGVFKRHRMQQDIKRARIEVQRMKSLNV